MPFKRLGNALDLWANLLPDQSVFNEVPNRAAGHPLVDCPAVPPLSPPEGSDLVGLAESLGSLARPSRRFLRPWPDPNS